ncbi:MAG: enoyl-CoA hydratase/isomerase family protein [Pyrinomonadaceae bacterium]|nr:enoyl-CoA hydratase/isomerase family protein [Pyrinomonadaceae bacterium]
MSNAIIFEQINRITIVRFNRPEIRSPLSISVLDELHSIVDSVSYGAAGLVFTGVGDVFASGADLREIAAVNGDNARDFALRGQTLMSKIASISIETIAAVNGFCYGGALDLALACGRRVASPNAEFCHPGAGLGIMTGWGGTQRLPLLVGEAEALEMFMMAKRVSADQALEIGLIDEINDDPLARAVEMMSVV